MLPPGTRIRDPGTSPGTSLASFSASAQPHLQSGSPQGHSVAAKVPGFMSRCHNA